MKNKYILEKLTNEIKNSSPYNPEIILKCKKTDKEKGRNNIDMDEINLVNEQINAKPNYKLFTVISSVGAIAAVFFIILGVILFKGFDKNVNSIINLDVNPSIEIKLNNKDVVVSVEALNEDASVILGDMKLENVDFDVAVNAIIGSMVQNGYIDEIKNSILISVDNSDPEKSENLKKHLFEVINKMLQKNNINPSVLTQSVSEDEQLIQLAKEHNISVGKASLINKILQKDKTKTFDELSKMTINEICVLADKKDIDYDDIEIQGKPNTDNYITKEQALDTVLNNLLINKEQISNLEIEFDYENSIFVYEIEFNYNNFSYKYDINAVNGSIVSQSKEENSDSNAEEDEEDNEKINSSSSQNKPVNKPQNNIPKPDNNNTELTSNPSNDEDDEDENDDDDENDDSDEDESINSVNPESSDICSVYDKTDSSNEDEGYDKDGSECENDENDENEDDKD